MRKLCVSVSEARAIILLFMLNRATEPPCVAYDANAVTRARGFRFWRKLKTKK
jgi:hypothetical protein